LPRFARNSTSPVGGTSMAKPKGSPTLAIVLAIAVGGGIIAYFALRTGKSAKKSGPAVGEQIPNNPSPDQTAPTAPSNPGASAVTPAQPQTQHPTAIAADLQRSLDHQRMWSTVNVVGDHVDIRSGSCSDAGMKPALDAVAAAFKAAGITHLRCLEQSGTVAFDRAL
jgi:hypothetical protein